MEGQKIYRAFLDLCFSEKMTVWADPNLWAKKQTNGHWNGRDHIVVYRSEILSPICVHRLSKPQKVDEFIAGSTDPTAELIILLHEYGHYFHQHPSEFEDAVVLYAQEVEAWEKAAEVAATLGITDFTVFNKERNEALWGYRKGLGLSEN